jgi:hypothetical protein
MPTPKKPTKGKPENKAPKAQMNEPKAKPTTPKK